MAIKRTNLQDRYELREALGHGGMGVVYRAYDTTMKREVALKTILDIDNPATVTLFYKEWSILSTMVHPNVINIYDIGEFEEEGIKKPFFVMPLLPGVTLDRLIKDGSPRLSVKGLLDLMEQACRGLHAAHEQGLVHRDVKPSNIFVMDDNSVKIIDFGIARQAAATSNTSLKGTLYYLAPEQLQMKPPTPLSDLYALAVVTYEALTRHRPFTGGSDSDVVEAILHHSPPPISELNPDVSYAISQVVHKAMAKQPWHRFFNMREFGDALQKAFRGEPLEYFDVSKIKPRLERAEQSFSQGDYDFASEILSELEAEGQLDQQIGLLRGRVDQAVRQTRIQQLLENARRFFQATEYSLALRKVQEALELDPNDPGAVTMKAQIEKERREKKISEWITLARQHLDNQAFRQAREALDNVLQLKPNETDALRLLAEVGRREQEVARIRDEKARLYQAAMQAWEKGEVSAAMTKLEVLMAMNRDLPESDSARSSSYQNFYNQVHSEHNAIKNSYDEARRNLSADNFEAALAICRQCLTKYPNHALFQALKFDVEERRRQNLSTVIAETDRRVDEEQDLDKRVGILEEAVKLYPGEPHFDRAMSLVRDKRDLVNSIIAKARYFEERGQYVEALDQWQILKSIHEKQPGLAFEIQRLIKRRDQQALQSSRTRWVEQTDKYLEGGDYDRAMKTVQSALVEFPNEPELLELDKLVRKSQERAKQAVELLEHAREASEAGATRQSLELLHEAREFDPRNSVIRTVLVNTLLVHARNSVDSDCDAADAAVQEVLQLVPNHMQAQSLASQISDKKREDFISWCLTQARRLQTDGDITGALALAAQGLASYPNDPRLQKLQALLQRAEAERRASTTTFEGRELPKQSPPAAPPSTPAGTPPPEAPAIVPPSEIFSASALQQSVPPPAAAVQPGDSSASGAAPTPPDVPPRPAGPSPRQAGPPPRQAGPPPRPPGPPPRQAGPPPGPPEKTSPLPPAPPPGLQLPWGPRLDHRQVVLTIGGVAAAVLLIAGGLFYSRSQNKPKAPPARPAALVKYKVNVRASQPAADLIVNGQACGRSTCDLDLAPGDYVAEAHLPGYEPATANFSVTSGQSSPLGVNLILRQTPPLMTISTDLASGKVLLDQAPAGQIQGGELDIASLAPGHHTLSLEGGAFRAAVPFDLAEGALPKLTGPIQTQGMRGLVVIHSGREAKVYGSEPGAQVNLDGKPVGSLTADGLEIPDLAAGSHELVVQSPAKETSKVIFDSGSSTSIFASLLTNQNLAVLNISSSDDGVDIYINGEKYRRQTKNGALRIYLPPKSYSVHAQRDGFAASPDQTVELRPGQEAKIDVRLMPLKAALSIHHGVPGSDVSLDGTSIGVIGSNGEFSMPNLMPGRHSVSIRHDRYKAIQSDQVFIVGKPVELEGALQSAFGTLRIELNPGNVDAHLKLRRDGDQRDQDINRDANLSLPEGSYTVVASAPPRYQDATATVHIVGGKTSVATLTLKRLEVTVAKAPPPVPIFGMDDWRKTGDWTPAGNMLTHKGDEFVLSPVDFGPGAIQFTAALFHGKHLEWVLAYRDRKNYLLVQVDDSNFSRYEVYDGKKSPTLKVPLGFKRNGFIHVSITITPTGISHSITHDQEPWRVIDQWDRPSAPVSGKFGFHMASNRDELAISDFHYTPK
ncbi:MAG TPA: protein kinase [Bryobacteraceae bacterium]|nr:protein kinase [Bryobacteraceae bacterium]